MEVEEKDALMLEIESIAYKQYPDISWYNKNRFDKNLEILKQLEKDMDYYKADEKRNYILIAEVIILVFLSVACTFLATRDAITEEVKDTLCPIMFEKSSGYIKCEQTKDLKDFYSLVLKENSGAFLDDQE